MPRSTPSHTPIATGLNLPIISRRKLGYGGVFVKCKYSKKNVYIYIYTTNANFYYCKVLVCKRFTCLLKVNHFFHYNTRVVVNDNHSIGLVTFIEMWRKRRDRIDPNLVS